MQMNIISSSQFACNDGTDAITFWYKPILERMISKVSGNIWYILNAPSRTFDQTLHMKAGYSVGPQIKCFHWKIILINGGMNNRFFTSSYLWRNCLAQNALDKFSFWRCYQFSPFEEPFSIVDADADFSEWGTAEESSSLYFGMLKCSNTHSVLQTAVNQVNSLMGLRFPSLCGVYLQYQKYHDD